MYRYLIKFEYLKRTRLKILTSCFVLQCIILAMYTYYSIYNKYTYCYNELVDDEIPDVLNEYEDPPPLGKSIFFHETSCSLRQDKLISLTPRQACAVESAAKHNPNSTVYLLYASPVRFPNASIISHRKYGVLKELLKYKNIKIRRVFLETYIRDTPLELWYQMGQLRSSHYLTSHTSDVLRFLSLWKFGGTYLDLDVVVMKNLENLPPNYAGAESKYNVAVGVVNFDHENFGHRFADMCLQELSNNFRGYDWGYNGPGVITRVLKRICHVEKTSLMTPKRCKGFTVYKPGYFYPIFWKDWRLYFDPARFIVALNKIRESYAIHVWNKFSTDVNVTTKEQDVAYGAMARIHCPNVFRESGDVF